VQLTVADLTFDVLSWGGDDGPPVLCLHGFPEGAACWGAVGPALAGHGLQVAAPDQRGYSPTARPTAPGAYHLDALVGDVVGLLDAAGWPSAHVVGHDWGAVVAWTLAARHPQRVRSLTALSVPHPAVFAATIATDADQATRSAYLQAFATPGVAEGLLLADDAARLRGLFDGSGLDAAAVNALVAPLLDPPALTAALGWYRGTPPAVLAGVPSVQVPTTFVWGDRDVAVGPVAAQGCARACSGSYRFVPLPASHWLPEQVPQQVADLVAEQVAAASG
jgi:pimeloyl-ACP methyl ester carboxylesterase